jgi:hypothetical protein
MNSHRIRKDFGSYEVRVITQTNNRRVANLCSVHNGVEICRTLAVTDFRLPVPPVLREAHEKIIAGASIGETLHAMGFKARKTNDVWCCVQSGERFSALTNHEVESGTNLAARLYTLEVSVNDDSLKYAVIAEAYHPQHIAFCASTHDGLQRLNGEQNAVLSALDGALIGNLSA